MDLKTFLLARIAEDEAAAQAVVAKAAPDEWENPTSWGNFYAEEIAFWDRATPARVLAECAAKRAIVELADTALATEVKRRDASALGADLMHRDVLRAIAAVYADHPGYQPEWAQEASQA